ncbi:hypothetical protein ACEQPO_29695 [Bacillus sp. SL00103]
MALFAEMGFKTLRISTGVESYLPYWRRS